MNRLKSLFLVVLSLAFTASLHAETVAQPTAQPARQIARFTVWLDLLDKDLLGLTPEEAPDRLVASKSRAITFNIQALGRLYASEDPAFERIRNKFKRLEDDIGTYQKWVDLDNDGREKGVSEVVQTRLTANRDAARIVLVNTLIANQFITVDSQSVPYNQELRTFLKNYPWKDAVSDRNMIMNKFIAELEKIRTTTYDFNKLEASRGVHDFRKDLRWISMETRGLNGLVTLKPRETACPIDVYANVPFTSIASTKYAVLPASANEPDTVTLTPCLYVQIARLVEDVNQVKARAELDDNLAEGESTDLVAPEEAAKVQAMLDTALSTQLFERLQEEFRAGLVQAPVEGQELPIPVSVENQLGTVPVQ